MRRSFKRSLIVLAVLFLCVAAAIFFYPYWFPHAARPIAARFGASFDKFERLEGGRFALSDVVYTNDAVTVKVTKVEGFLPHVWYRKKAETNSEKAFLEVNGWKVILQEGSPKGEEQTSTNLSVYAQFHKYEPMLQQALEWLPKAQLLNGIVEVKGMEYTFPLIMLENGQLNADGVWPENAIPLEIKAKLAEQPYQISYAMHRLDLRARVRLFQTNNALAANFTGFYLENRLDGAAEFDSESGILPRTANVKANEFKLPAELLQLKGYRDVSGSIRGEWKSNQYTASLEAHAEPIEGGLPLLDVNVAASGNTNVARLEKLDATMPGLKVALSAPVEVNYAGRMLSGQSELAIDAQLEDLPWGNLEGEMKGTVLLKPGAKIPVFWVRARGTNLAGYNLNAKSIEASIMVEWPYLRNLEFETRLGTDAVVKLAGGANLRDRTLNDVRLSVSGSVSTNILPAGISFSSAAIEATASGPITNLQHGGTVELHRFTAPGMEPLNLEAAWQARLFAFERLAMQARAGGAMLRVNGEGAIDERGTNFTVRELTLNKGEEIYLKLAQPFDVQVLEGPRVAAEEMVLRGPDRELRFAAALQWPKEGEFQLAARNVNPELLQSFVTRSLRGLELPDFRLAAGWSNGPVTGFVQGEVGLEEQRFGQLRASIGAQLDEGGLALTNLTVSDASGDVAKAAGFLPLSVNPVATNGFVQLSRREEMDFLLHTAPSDHFWSVVSELTKLQLSNPAVRLELHGTVRKPAGELVVQAAHVGLSQTNRELPSAQSLDVHLALDEQTLQLQRLETTVEGQQVSATGTIPLGTNFWALRREEIVNYLLDHAKMRLTAPEVQLGPFAKYAPKYLAQRGMVSINVQVMPGRQLGGTIAVRGVETRPISKVGVIQDISADLKLNGTEVAVEEIAGTIGGRRVTIEGKLDLANEHLVKGYPRIELAIRGTNVPLARNPDIILRSDLDLRVKNGTNWIPMVTGDVTLQDSFLMRDIATMVPGRVASPERRPPYFSIPQEPIDSWRLDLRVRGIDFMRVRSPFFHGVASANFHVTGTMEEPRALGEAAITSGRVIFPFASLEVKQALVSLTEENPYLPTVFVTSAGRAFGFDIRMQVEGFADEPVIEFSSVPALTSEQIILMLTTGQIPREDFGFSQEDRASKLAFFLGKSLWEKLNPGKAGEERLSIRSGQDITEQGKQTYEVEYKLTDRWSLVGEYDRFGALNANLKWKLFSR